MQPGGTVGGAAISCTSSLTSSGSPRRRRRYPRVETARWCSVTAKDPALCCTPCLHAECACPARRSARTARLAAKPRMVKRAGCQGDRHTAAVLATVCSTPSRSLPPFGSGYRGRRQRSRRHVRRATRQTGPTQSCGMPESSRAQLAAAADCGCEPCATARGALYCATVCAPARRNRPIALARPSP